MGLLSDVGIAFLARWVHFLAGITWIGILYYFNFVQVPAFAEMQAPARSEALRKVTFRALWWFRWGAVVTVLSGLTMLVVANQLSGAYMRSPAGISISTGTLLGLVMFANVWGVIWRAQKVAIASAEKVAAGGEADPAAAAAARRGFIASRTNTVFSISLLFFMAATTHFVGTTAFVQEPASDARMIWWGLVLVLTAAIEANALGVLGYAPNWNTKPLDTIKSVLISGFGLLAVLYVAFFALFGQM